jgi:cytochrome c peroxidase
VAFFWAIALGVACPARADLPPVPVPAENPITEPKRVLGKILFWDEQLSTSNVVSCGTCHVPGRAGADPRIARNPGRDGLINTPDDVLGSPGIIRSNAANDYERDAVFGLLPQITGRAANSPINSGYAPELFWDGRARSTFVDPQTGEVAIAAGGALESQAVAPILNNVEMAHAGLNWDGVCVRLASVRPLELATNIPPDVAAVLAERPSYAELFRRAFGDGEITARRVAFAIATYQRTLISDQAPWDRFIAGQTNALTPQQAQGWQLFQGAARCNDCHTAPHFTDFSFRNIGLRPIEEDRGRQDVTGLAGDRGRFKVPSLRNAGLKRTYMHNGQFQSIQQVMGFYARGPGAPPQFPDNRDPLMTQIVLPPQDAALIDDFIRNGLTDPRVAAEQFPFDRPVLYSERPANQAVLIGGGTAGSGGFVPTPIVQAPPLVGSREYRVGLDRALGGTTARLALAFVPPVNGRITPQVMLEPVPTGGTGPGNGVATVHFALRPWQFRGGRTMFAQWIINDPGAPAGTARSAVAQIPLFCGSYGCPCPADVNADGEVDFNDLLEFLNFFQSAAFDADVNLDGVVDFNDLLEFLNIYNTAC